MVSKSIVAGASVVVAIVAVSALAVVASIENASALATVALALALLSFVLQVLMFIVQSYATSSQMLEAQKIYSQMADALAEIKTRTESTQTTVEKVSDKLLEAILEKAAAESGSPVDFSPATARRVRDSLATESQFTGRGAYPPPEPDSRIVRLLLTWPSEDEAAPIAQVLGELGEYEASGLARLASDELRTRAEGVPVGPGLYGAYSGLKERGLIEFVPGYVDSDGDLLARLTEQGRMVARVFTATPPAPPHLADLVREYVDPVWARAPDALRPPSRQEEAPE